MYVNYSWTVALLDGVPAEALLDGAQDPRRPSADLHLYLAARRGRQAGSTAPAGCGAREKRAAPACLHGWKWKTTVFGWERWQPLDLLSTVDLDSEVPR